MRRVSIAVLLLLSCAPRMGFAQTTTSTSKRSQVIANEKQLAEAFFKSESLKFTNNPIGVRTSLQILSLAPPTTVTSAVGPVCAPIVASMLKTLQPGYAHFMYRASDAAQRLKPLFEAGDDDHVCMDPSSQSTGATDSDRAFWILVISSNCVAQQAVINFGVDDDNKPCKYQPLVLYLYANPNERAYQAGNILPTAGASGKSASPPSGKSGQTTLPSSGKSFPNKGTTPLTSSATKPADVPALTLKAVLVWISDDAWVSQSWLTHNASKPSPGESLGDESTVDQSSLFQLVIDGKNVNSESEGDDAALFVDRQPCQKSSTIEVYLRPRSCRTYVRNGLLVSVPVALTSTSEDQDRCPREQDLVLDNGITIGKPKIYDTFALRKLLTATATQLASIVPFNSTAITNAYGTIQGVQRDTSYLAAQISTAAGPNTTSTLSAPGTTTQTTTPIAGASSVSQAVQCPTNFVPSYTQGSSSSTWTCVASNGNTAPAMITTTTTPASGSSTVVNAANQSNTTQTVQNGVAAVIPTAPTSTALQAPTGTSVSASDMLAEQVQLSAQLSMLQMLLKGADSDQLLVSNGRAVAMRKQTTLSFPITLRPPAPFKHAVAEVRVMMIPRKVAALPNSKMDIVTLLPSEKTYNVAKITSKQKSFGAGVVVEAISLGVSTGKSHDRLYIVKDTDTVALQYPTTKLEGILAAWPSRIAPAVHNGLLGKSGELDTDENCLALPPSEVFENSDVSSGKLDTARYDFPDAVMFGWQFRPVLGAEYVASNVRNVFAQIALPTEESSESAPLLDIFVQTRWRQYSPSGQVTGPSYSSTCQWMVVENSITIDNPMKVKDVTVTDTGGGVLRFRAEGDLLSSSFTVRNGSALIPPTFFDGRRIEFFENAEDVLHGGDIELVGEDGSETPVVIPSESPDECSIVDSQLIAIPRPDGNARVIAKVTRGDRYTINPFDDDGVPDYKIMIGSDVYGLRETPFLGEPDCDNDHSCTYQFESQYAGLRAARNYLVRDLAWDAEGKRGTIKFAPAFNSVTALQAALAATKAASDADCSLSYKAPSIKGKVAISIQPQCTWYEVKGTDFLQIAALAPAGSLGEGPKLVAYQDNDVPINVVAAQWPATDGEENPNVNLRVIDDNTLRVRFPGVPRTQTDGSEPDASQKSSTKTIHLMWLQSATAQPVDWPLKLSSAGDTGSASSAAKFSADPPVLFISDSRAVKFTSNTTIGCFMSAQFEGGANLLQAAQPSPGASAQPNISSFTLQIPSSLTAKPGYKEIVVKVNKASTSGGRITCTPSAAKDAVVGILVVGPEGNRN